MSRFQLRRAHIALASTAVVAALACSKSDAPPKDTAKAAAAAPAAAPVQKHKPMPGDLTKPIDAYTGDEFQAFVKGLSYIGGHERQRKCKNDPACSGSKTTPVLVEAVATQDSIAPSTVPQFGVVYVHAINKGDAAEARYGMLPVKDKYEYYMIVMSDSSGNAMNWRLEQLDNTIPKAPRHSSIGSGQFVSCNHAWVAGARADFKTCANAASAKDSTVKLGLALQGIDGDPIWAACAGGCCVGQ